MIKEGRKTGGNKLWICFTNKASNCLVALHHRRPTLNTN